MSPALAGEFFTTGLPGKCSCDSFYFTEKEIETQKNQKLFQDYTANRAEILIHFKKMFHGYQKSNIYHL